jgi:hypothetical protein
MRGLALAAALAGGLVMGGVAAADPWVDPAGRLNFTAPSGWRVQPQAVSGQTAVLAFNPTSDCYLFGLVNPNTADATANAVRNTTTPLSNEAWTGAASTLRDFFPDGVVQVVSQSVDTSGFWPVQRAELRGTNKTVYAVLQGRPGLELRALCTGASSAAAYEPIFASMSSPNDATWRTEAEQQAASRAASEAARQQAAQTREGQQGRQTTTAEEQQSERAASEGGPRRNRRPD